MADLQILAQTTKLLPFELFFVVSDDHFWDPKAAHDVSPKKVDHFLFCNGGQGLCLYPFGEVVTRP